MQSDWVLIADDDPVTREILSVFLQSLNFQVRAAKSGGECVSLLNHCLLDASSPKVMFVDFQLGDMTAGEVLESALKLWPNGRPFPVVLCSANSAEELSLLAPNLTVDSIIEKPFTASDIERVMRQFA